MIPKRQQQQHFCCVVVVFLVLLFINHCEGQQQNCNNSFFALIRTQGIFFRRMRTCWWVRRDTSRCDVINLNTNLKVGFTCAVECPNISRCGMIDTPSVAPNQQQDVPTAPTIPNIPTGPMLLPSSPARPPVFAPIVIVTSPTTLAPTADQSKFPPFPVGPYITIDKSSEVVKIPRPPINILTTADNPSLCPHLSNGLKRWHDANTWGDGTIPTTTGQDVTLPPSTRVLIDQSIMQKLGVITIPSTSELIIGTNVSGITIDVTGIMVFGKLTAGSENCHISTPITITLHGTRPNNAVTVPPPSTYKGILVSGEGSKIGLHGKIYYQTWTRLSKTVQIGEQVILLQEKVNWQIGQQIVIITSSMKDSRDNNQNEKHTISNINYNPPNGIGTIVYISKPMKYKHIANSLYQVEVGLLSRTIKIQGADDDSEPTDPDPNTCLDPYNEKSWTIYYNTSQPCMNKHLTGYGGHVRIENNGIGQINGIELYRMGQTNVLGRYPIHFHLLNNCPTCYVRSSSIHHSFYRCISIHGTNNVTISENVAYDVTGYCYYLEDGIEQYNTISYNLAAHIHTIGPDLPRGGAQTIPVYKQNDDLTLPADVTASGFYITNIHNNIIGNAASGGWAGFAFPTLITPLQTFRTSGYRPYFETNLIIDGNTAHSTAWWWYHAGAFYFGGELYYNSNNVLEYNAGRGFNSGRSPCKKDPCLPTDESCPTWKCTASQQSWLRITNTKTFLNAGVGMNSWTGRVEVVGFEAHDSGLGLEALSEGFWLDNALIVCRTGESLGFQKANKLSGNGFVWYDTGQDHVISRATYRNCGYRSDSYNQYDQSISRGCGDDPENGCESSSSVFGFLTHSDEFTPEVMQGTKAIAFQNCGRRFRFSNEALDSVSGRAQNWLDTDGSVSGLGVPTLIGSGLWSVKDWWGVDPNVVYDPQAPLRFIAKNNGPKRNIGHINFRWDDALHNQVGGSLCGNGNGKPCPWEGFIRHAGKMFTPNKNNVNNGMPLTARGDVAGPTGGYGWIINFNTTAPRLIKIEQAEIYPDTLLVISIPYPINTKFTITAESGGCWIDKTYNCTEVFQLTSNITEVRLGTGNKYHVDNNGVVTFRIIQTPSRFTGTPKWMIPDYTTTPRLEEDLWSLPRFNRSGVILPQSQWGNNYRIQAKCPGDNADSPTIGYCTGTIPIYDPDVCPVDYKQTAYDTCCQSSDLKKCVYSDGSRNF